MAEPQWIWRRDRAIPSSTREGRDVLQELLDRLEENHWSEHDLFCVHLAVEEALINAVKHGNRQDATKRIRVVSELSRDLLRIEISDEGRGFDPALLPDPTDPARLESPSGRGIMLMQNFMSRVEYLDGGARVVLEKRRTPAGRGVS
jgi:serine/threonine-protein kinase RsbW